MARAEAAFAGQTINSYRIVQKLGSGGMGLVFRAVDIRLNRSVALKFLPDDLDASARARSLLLLEAQAASALDHPNVGTIYGIEQTPAGRMFIVMAFYDGQTLAQRIASEGPIPIDEAIRITAQIANGMAEAHAHQIVHRDIKPSNVLITAQGVVKILDFGLARVLSSTSMTQSIGLAGTVAYMSPQQALGRAIDQRTDLWSLGITLYEMLTARLPFDADSNAAVLMAIVHTAPRELDRSIAPALQRIVYRLLVKEPLERYQDITAVQADLNGLIESRPSGRVVTQSELNRLRSLVARPMALSARVFSRAERWSIALLCLVVAGLALALIPGLRRPFAGPAAGQVQHIAVLPLTTKTSAASDAELAEGLRESITDRLSNLQAADRSLWVVPASEVSAHKVSGPAEAIKAFGANLVVLGRLERVGRLVRLRLELVDATQMRQLGAADAESSDGNLSELEDTAMRELEHKLDLSPANTRAEQAAGSVPATAYENYLKALPLIDRWDKPNNIESANRLLEAAIRRDPEFTLAYVSLANADLIQYRLTRDKIWLEKATNNCDRAQQLNSELPGVHVMMGRVQDASGRYNLALQEFKRGLDLEPHSADARLGIALVYDHQGRTGEAEQSFKQAVALRPDYWDVYDQLGNFYRRHDRNDDAIAQFEHAIRLAPDSRASYQNLGAALIDAGRPDDAIRAFQKVSAIAPSYGVSANLGVIYLQRRRFPEAEKATEDALRMNDKDWRVWTNLVTIRRWLKEDQKANEAEVRAIPLMQNAIRVQPEDSELHADLGVVYADLGRDKDARSEVETALALGSGNGAIEAAAAEVYERLGDHKEALAFLKRALHDGAAVGDFAMDLDMQPVLADPEISRSIKPVQ